MRLSTRFHRFLKALSILFLIFLLSACGGRDERAREGPPVNKGSQEETSLSDEEPVESSDGFVDIPLPENFPPTFPIPEGARIGSSGQEPAEGTFQILIYPGGGIEDGIDFYRQALPDNGWTILQEEALEDDYGMTVSNQEFEGEMYFTVYEDDAFIDVSLVPADSVPDVSDLGMNFGESTELGESGSDFPADFPLPVGGEAINISDKLGGEGYQLAFSFPAPPELATIQLSGAMASAGWMIGEIQVDIATMSYTIPFSNPGTGFEGHVLLTANPDVAGVDQISGCIFALSPATP